MPGLEPTLEIERIQNLILNFNWKIDKQEISDTSIILTISKPKDTSLDEASAGSS